jgi:hypothetical protein
VHSLLTPLLANEVIADYAEAARARRARRGPRLRRAGRFARRRAARC